MVKRSSMILALTVIAVLGVSAVAGQLALRDDGIEFPDGSVQTSAAETAGEFVQGAVTVVIPDMFECANGNLYAVPLGKRLRIEFLTIEAAAPTSSDFDPVDVDIWTWAGGVQTFNWLTRLDGAIVVGTSIFRTVRWSAPVTLYSQGDQTVEVRACRDIDSLFTDVRVTFHGQLFDE